MAPGKMPIAGPPSTCKGPKASGNGCLPDYPALCTEGASMWSMRLSP